MNKILTTLIIAIATTLPSLAADVQTYTVKVGEVIKLEIPSAGRTILSRATNRRGNWSLNTQYLEIVSSSWDYCYVKGKKATNLASVQLTVTFNMNGHYGDKYYAAYNIKVTPDGPTSISLTRRELEMKVGEIYTLQATITGSPGTYKWTSSNSNVVSIKGNGLKCDISANSPGTAYITVSTGKYTATAEITVKEAESTAIENVRNDHEIKFQIMENNIIFENECNAMLFDISGKLIFNGTTRSIDDISKGIYILRTNNRNYKICI